MKRENTKYVSETEKKLKTYRKHKTAFIYINVDEYVENVKAGQALDNISQVSRSKTVMLFTCNKVAEL